MQTATDHDAAVMALVPGLEYVATFVPFSKSRNRDEDRPTLNWEIEIRHGGAKIVTDYGQGIAHLPHYEHQFASLVVYDKAVRVAAETGVSMLQPGQKNGYDACRADKSVRHFGKPIPAPSVADVLYCLLGDAEALDYATFEEWADNYGYDTDSRKAESIYRKCLEIGLRLRAMFGDAKMAELREALRDM